MEQYRLALIVAARRYKRYPAIAMEKGWQGRVEVQMVIGANGMLANASIKSGSGHEILDNQALDMLKKGKTTVPIPMNLRGREFSIVVPVIFNLDTPNS
jgi:protein TonB